MISSFSTALGTALTSFVSDVSTAIGSNAATVIPVALGVVGIFLLLGVILRLARHR